jgi:hypothetical protein
MTYQEVNSRLAMMEYGNANYTPAVPVFLENSFTVTYVSDVRGEIKDIDENAVPIRGIWPHVAIVKLAYIAFLTGNVLEPPSKTASIKLNYTVWLADECMDYFSGPSKCSAPYAMEKFMEILYGKKLAGVSYPASQASVGASRNSLEAAQVAALKGVPMVGYDTSSTPLSNKVNFPTYLRTQASMRTEAAAMATYLRHVNKYTRIDSNVCDTFSMRNGMPELGEVFRDYGILENYVVYWDQQTYTGLPPEFCLQMGILACQSIFFKAGRPKLLD